MPGFFRSPTSLKPGHPKHGARQFECFGTVVRHVEFFCAEDLHAVANLVSRLTRVQFLPRHVVENVPASFVLRRFDKVEIDLISPITDGRWHNPVRLSVERNWLSFIAFSTDGLDDLQGTIHV